MSPPYVAICNPISGRYSSLPRLLRLRQALLDRGADLQIHTTTQAGHATTLAAEASPDTPAIIVAGGDGTLCEVVNGLGSRGTPIALLPSGTENLLGRSLGLPVDPLQAAETLFARRIVRRDAAEANGRVFLAVGGVGFDADCVDRLCRRRRGHIVHADYFVPIWRTFWEHRFPEIHVVANDRVAFDGRGLLIFGLIDRYAAGLPVLPGADPTDGLLDVAIFPCRTRRQLVGHACCVALREWARQASNVIHLKCTNVTITCRTQALTQLDGERGPPPPLACRVLPAFARFVVGKQNPAR